MSFISNKFLKNNLLLKKNNILTSTVRLCLSTSSVQLSISQEQLKEYEKNGFFVVRKLIKSESLEKFRKRFQKICSEKIKIPGFNFNQTYFVHDFKT